MDGKRNPATKSEKGLRDGTASPLQPPRQAQQFVAADFRQTHATAAYVQSRGESITQFHESGGRHFKRPPNGRCARVSEEEFRLNRPHGAHKVSCAVAVELVNRQGARLSKDDEESLRKALNSDDNLRVKTAMGNSPRKTNAGSTALRYNDQSAERNIIEFIRGGRLVNNPGNRAGIQQMRNAVERGAFDGTPIRSMLCDVILRAEREFAQDAQMVHQTKRGALDKRYSRQEVARRRETGRNKDGSYDMRTKAGRDGAARARKPANTVNPPPVSKAPQASPSTPLSPSLRNPVVQQSVRSGSGPESRIVTGMNNDGSWDMRTKVGREGAAWARKHANTVNLPPVLKPPQASPSTPLAPSPRNPVVQQSVRSGSGPESRSVTGKNNDGSYDMRTKVGRDGAARARKPANTVHSPPVSKAPQVSPSTPLPSPRNPVVQQSVRSCSGPESRSVTGKNNDGSWDMRTKVGKEGAARAGASLSVSPPSTAVINSAPKEQPVPHCPVSQPPPPRPVSPPSYCYSSYDDTDTSSFLNDFAGSACYAWNGNTDGPMTSAGLPDMRYACNRR